MYAIVVTGGKQYKVAEGDIIEVEKLEVENGGSVELNVALLVDGSTVITEADKLANAKVFATVVEQFKGDKQIIFKFKKRKGYKRLRGHRQNLTRLEIASISATGTAPKKKAAAKPAEKKTESANKAVAGTNDVAEKPKAAAKTALATKAAPAAKTVKAIDKSEVKTDVKPKKAAVKKSEDAEKKEPAAKKPAAKKTAKPKDEASE